MRATQRTFVPSSGVGSVAAYAACRRGSSFVSDATNGDVGGRSSRITYAAASVARQFA